MYYFSIIYTATTSMNRSQIFQFLQSCFNVLWFLVNTIILQKSDHDRFWYPHLPFTKWSFHIKINESSDHFQTKWIWYLVISSCHSNTCTLVIFSNQLACLRGIGILLGPCFALKFTPQPHENIFSLLTRANNRKQHETKQNKHRLCSIADHLTKPDFEISLNPIMYH